MHRVNGEKVVWVLLKIKVVRLEELGGLVAVETQQSHFTKQGTGSWSDDFI